MSFICQACGAVHLKWMGRCPHCGAFDTLTEQVETKEKKKTRSSKAQSLPLKAIPLMDSPRIPSGMEGVDRVLGGGWVPGSLVLLGGEPGVGKSTLLLQVSASLLTYGKVVYVSGEESFAQIGMRAKRLKVPEELIILCDTRWDAVTETLKEIQPQVVMVDSIQTLTHPDYPSSPGSVAQVRAVTQAILEMAKQENILSILVGHITKEGYLAGPKTLEHMVDVVLSFEGERDLPYRLLRAYKNRFGSTDEACIFMMTPRGLVEETNPSRLFYTRREENPSGTAVTCLLTGSRPILREIQALVTPTPFPNPRRVAVGYDYHRLLLILAVLQKEGLNLHSQDVILNVAGALPVRETGADLATAVAIASALLNKPLPTTTLFIGEVSLTGEIRGVSRMDQREKEARRFGFQEIIKPSAPFPTLDKVLKHFFS